MELGGTYRPKNLLERWIRYILLWSVYVLMSAGSVFLVYEGLWAALHRDDRPGMWILLPAGLFQLAIIHGFAFLLLIAIPRRTLREFHYDGERFAYRTDSTKEMVNLDLGEIHSVLTYTNQRGGGDAGFRIRTQHHSWIWLTPETLNADQLVTQLKADLKARDAREETS